MGAWGLGLFQSDYDDDLISELHTEAGLPKFVDGDDMKNFRSLYAPFDSNPSITRNHLDSGVLEPHKKDRFPPAYIVVIIGALAMGLGCRLLQGLRNLMNDNYLEIGLMRDSKTQIEKALEVYCDRSPYDYRSKDLNEVIRGGGPPLANS
ncbi:hypothetical protein K402DRAFT_407523 [Aulographum hederae CBS 113979]|uniref:Uncharacterized protein n=1 Tax=Aulographum hederae CBS 113979 TaxID=1176131 RepID=A0A6G1GNW1_9PEZI|nr:hypothetical protein K402DRAFT_407523 [Aulographum hederae CBS 113979]